MSPTHRQRYRVHGLTLESALALPELPAATDSEPPDIVIELGPTPATLDQPTAAGACYETAPGRFLIRLEGEARFLVTEGRTLRIEIEPGADPAEVRRLLLTSPLGALLLQRGLLAFHASAIAIGDVGVLFLGGPNTGKSTLAAHCQARGDRVLCDDLAAVRFDEAGQPWVLPGWAGLKLWPDMLTALGRDRTELPRLREDCAKRVLGFPEKFDPSPVPLRAAYVLATGPGSAIALARVEGAGRGAALLQQTYRPDFIGGAERRARHLGQIARLAARVPVTRISRPHELSFDDALVERIRQECHP